MSSSCEFSYVVRACVRAGLSSLRPLRSGRVGGRSAARGVSGWATRGG